jgi:hypothetical protein
MKLTPVQDLATAARMALVVGAITFDWLFAGVEFHEADGDLLYVFARDEEAQPKWRIVSPFTLPSSRRAF